MIRPMVLVAISIVSCGIGVSSAIEMKGVSYPMQNKPTEEVLRSYYTITVDVNGPNDPGSGTAADPFRRIQDALDSAVDGDIIEVRSGIYTGAGNYDLDPNGKSVTLRSTNPDDSDIVAGTIVDPNAAGRGFLFVSGEDANCVISGLTICNGLAADASGGAILCTNGSGPTITNCIVRDNVADWYGGAVYCDGDSPKIVRCTITGNSAKDGGAVECWSGIVSMQNCFISNNTASGSGGGIDCYRTGHAEVVNCTVVKNSAGSGGAVHCVDKGKATIQNSILWSNDANEGPQIAVESRPFVTSEVAVSYSDVQGGMAAVHVDPNASLIWGAGNMDADPCFASFDPNGDSELWDFHLQSAYGRWSADTESWVEDLSTSPCADAGDPNSDWTNELWPNGKRINMGRYGGTSQASKNGNIADFDVDGVVDYVDLADLADKWLAQELCIEDLNNDAIVNSADYAVFAENWLWWRE